MSSERRYQLQSEEANKRIEELLTSLGVPAETRRAYAEMLTTVLKMFEDGADPADLKIANAVLKEVRYGFKVFAPYRGVRKVTVFGSARTQPEDPVSLQAHAFSSRMVEAGWMVITGAGDGVMAAAQEGAGRERSFGLNIRIPWEQEANPVIADDPKLINFKYFFIRKLFFLKEADAVCLFPGGFGTSDEAFEVLTLIQTGKAPVMPVVLLDEPGGQFWKSWEAFISQEMLGRGLISLDDIHLFRLTDDAGAAVQEILDFYRVFHSQRWLGDRLVLRLRRPLGSESLAMLEAQFDDLLRGKAEQYPGPMPQEGDEFPDLPRLAIPLVRSNYGRLRLLIDAINRELMPPADARQPARVLMVCTGNSARSQMAEGFLRAYGAGVVEPASAGMEPKGLNPHAVAVMAEKGIDISDQLSKAFSEPLARSMDYVITVCGNAETRCPVLPPSVHRLHWPLPDPARAEGTGEQVRVVFRQSRDEIERRVREFLATVNRPATRALGAPG